MAVETEKCLCLKERFSFFVLTVVSIVIVSLDSLIVSV
jgi:hypothetical protein